MGLPSLLIILIPAVLIGLLGRYVAKQKGRESVEGFLFGFFLSILGIIIVLLLPTKNKLD
jgi:uncharacterized membrane protein